MICSYFSGSTVFKHNSWTEQNLMVCLNQLFRWNCLDLKRRHWKPNRESIHLFLTFSVLVQVLWWEGNLGCYCLSTVNLPWTSHSVKFIFLEIFCMSKRVGLHSTISLTAFYNKSDSIFSMKTGKGSPINSTCEFLKSHFLHNTKPPVF